MATITAIILTYNEEQHIKRCIDSLSDLVNEIYVVDSFSNDRTIEIAKKSGAKVFQNAWVNYATQFNWALENCNIKSDWVWRIDADEYIDAKEKKSFIESLNNLSDTITGVYIKRKIVFMKKQLLHGGWYPVWHLKIWRNGKGFCENRWMDEHIKLTEGESIKLNCTQVDENLNDLTWWSQKHNEYATREMVDLLDSKYQIFSKNTVEPKLFGTNEQKKRWLKLSYLKLPLFIRPVIYFIYRYLFKLGFLDGKSGLVWHILQGFWYRFLVDSKIYELNLRFNHDENKIINYIKETYKID